MEQLQQEVLLAERGGHHSVCMRFLLVAGGPVRELAAGRRAGGMYEQKNREGSIGTCRGETDSLIGLIENCVALCCVVLCLCTVPCPGQPAQSVSCTGSSQDCQPGGSAQP